MKKRGTRSDSRRICSIKLAMVIAAAGLPVAARAGTVFTWEPAAVLGGASSAFTADAINATHYLYDRAPVDITPTDTYNVFFLEPITGFTLNGVPVATPGLNGTPGAAGSYGLYLTMENQTQAIGPPKNYNYLSGTVAPMLDPGNNDGTASSTLSGVGFSNTGSTGTADDITLATGSLVSGQFAFGSTPDIRSIGDFVETFQPAAGAGGFFATPPTDMIQTIDTTFNGDLVIENDPTDPSFNASVLNGGSTVIDFPVPEPESFLLLGVGLVGLTGLRLLKNGRRPR
ncbi:MAG: PEP-CTERM sorting domain-containing protein [Acetobacteraceae bacterium]|nr:PEP-CTERM sorting domain-containing protein [Acetobacteraceae bacterium]